MPSFSKGEVILVRYPFSDLTAAKVRPAVIVGHFTFSPDFIIVPLTSKISPLRAGEFVLTDWHGAGLNMPSAIKQGIYTIHSDLIVKSVGNVSADDGRRFEQSLREWLELP